MHMFLFPLKCTEKDGNSKNINLKWKQMEKFFFNYNKQNTNIFEK